MKELRRQIESYAPCDAREAQDKAGLIYALEHLETPLTRENPIAHFTASAWIVNPARNRVLMVWHNIYRTWSWTGGHADGEADLLAVALREAREETGLSEIAPVTRDIYSLEILPVFSHVKRGNFVSSHLHLNVTYLLEAGDTQPIRSKPDENSAVRWMALDEAAENKEEPFMAAVYRKLNEKLRMKE